MREIRYLIQIFATERAVEITFRFFGLKRAWSFFKFFSHTIVSYENHNRFAFPFNFAALDINRALHRRKEGGDNDCECESVNSTDAQIPGGRENIFGDATLEFAMLAVEKAHRVPSFTANTDPRPSSTLSQEISREIRRAALSRYRDSA